MGYIVDAVRDRIRKAILTSRDSIITPIIELAIRSTNASSGRDVTSVMASSESGELLEITAPLGNESERNSTLHLFKKR